MHKLIIEDDEGKAVVVPLIRDEISLGRQEGNTIRLTERNVSRKHARLVKHEGGYALEDLSSFTGTKLNGAPIKTKELVPLNDGDQVVIGDYRLAIKIERPTTTTLGFPKVAPPIPASPVAAAAIPVPPAPSPLSAAMATPLPVAASAPPSEPMDGQPTIPVRTLADQGLVPAAAIGAPVPSQPPARLVVVTTPFAGQEYVLDRASVVIGRTQENDIVLNHKSISRHHAKLIRDGDRYVVVDLESANGVRVNGAEYERVELQSGDVVELGHVRIRFVSADDPSTFEGEGHGFGGDRRKMFAIGGGVVVAAALALFIFSGKSEPTKPLVTEAARPAAPSVPAPAPAAESPASLLAHAKEAYKEQRWADALVAVTRAVAAAPGGLPEGDELRRAIETEQQNAARLETLQRAFDMEEYGTVLTGSTAIAESSVYKERAHALEQKARERLIAQHLALGERNRTDGECAAARKEAEAVLALDAASEAAKDLIARCGRTRAAHPVAAAEPEAKPASVARALPSTKAPVPATKAPMVAAASKPMAVAAPKPVISKWPPAPRAAARPAAVTARATEEPSGPAGDPEALLQEAQDAWLKGQYAVAIESSRKALRAKPGLTRAYQIIAVCSCSLRDSESAARAYERLDDRNKQLVKQLCQKSGVALE